ncbi:MAG: biotin--[acetyl-CoA-carboxylase] ligase [Octadecabacter sp.]
MILDQVDSTMAEARRRAPSRMGSTWILAHEQTAAHGRRGRAWTSPSGNFSATLMLKISGDPAQAALRSFTMAVALRQTLAMTVPPEQLSLKWPNDVLLGGGKVAGILLETNGQGGRIDWLSIGVGVNLVAAPSTDQVEPLAVRPVAASDFGTAHSPQDFLFWLASHFADLEKVFQEFGFGPIRTLWLKHAARLGETITARLPNEDITGVFETVDENGYLVLNTPKGARQIAAGDVFF